eukprot:364197-Chlamydomonas_euryale.AAC.31
MITLYNWPLPANNPSPGGHHNSRRINTEDVAPIIPVDKEGTAGFTCHGAQHFGTTFGTKSADDLPIGARGESFPCRLSKLWASVNSAVKWGMDV